MNLTQWSLSPAGVLRAAVLTEGGEPDVLAALAQIDAEARRQGLWLLGRARCCTQAQSLAVEVCTLPEVGLPEAGSLTAEYRLKPPAAAQIEQQLDTLARMRMLQTEDSAPARPGDLVTLSFDAMLEDGSRFSGSMGRHGVYCLQSGGELPAAVCSALVGRAAGERFVCDAALPGTFPDRRAAGRTARYTGTVERVVHQTPHPLDDALARSFGQADLAALRRMLEARFLQQEEQAAKRIAAQRALGRYSRQAQLTLPPLALELETAYQARLLEQRLEQSGITLESHLRRLHKTEAQLRASLAAHAEKDLRARAVFLAVARAEGLAVSEDALDEAARQAPAAQADRMQLRQRLGVEQGMRWVSHRIAYTGGSAPAAGAEGGPA